MSVLRNEFTKLMQKDMYKYFLESYDKYDPVYPKIFEVVTSNAGYEIETSAIGMGKLSEREEGASIVYSNPLEGFQVVTKMRTYSDGFSLSMEFVEDTPPEKIANAMQGFASKWAEGVTDTKEAFAASFFNNGGLTAGHKVFNNNITGVVSDPTGDLCYDGKPFFNLTGNARSAKAHSTTYYNGIASALDSSNLQTLYNLMTVTNNRDEKGDIIRIMPNILLHPGSLRFTVKSVLESDAIVGGSSASLNKNVVQGLLQPIEWAYLTDTDAWFLGVARKGLKFYERKAPVIDFYQNEETRAWHATIDTRFGASVNNWRYWAGSNFATS